MILGVGGAQQLPHRGQHAPRPRGRVTEGLHKAMFLELSVKPVRGGRARPCCEQTSLPNRELEALGRG